MTTPAMTDLDRERALFEAEMKSLASRTEFERRTDGEYVDPITEAHWETWQAARALPQQVVAAGIDTAELRKLALAATPGEWDFDTADTPFKIAGGEVVGGDALPWGDVYTVDDHDTFDEDGPCREPLTIVREIKVADGRYIAAANPKAILALLDTLDAHQPAPVKPEATTWSKAPPSEQGEYWHWNGDDDAAPYTYHVMWSGTAKKCFVAIGQYGIEEAVWCDEVGGWWMKIDQPRAPPFDAAILAQQGTKP